MLSPFYHAGTSPETCFGLWDLVFYGIVLITVTAPLPIFGIVRPKRRGMLPQAF